MKRHSPHGERSCDTLPDRPRVSQLKTDDNARSRRSLVLKLTDECNQALNKAIEMNLPVRIISTKEGIIVEIGNVNGSTSRFKCTQQSLNCSMDVVANEATSSYSTVSSLNTKLVVNATDKTFAETREKAQKLAEQEQRKMAKDTLVIGKSNKTKKGAIPLKPFSKPSVPPKKSSPNLTTNNAKTAPNSATKVTSAVNGIVQNRNELIKRSIRARVIHLCAGGKFKTANEVLERIKFEGITKPENWDSVAKEAQTIISEVSIADPDALSVKPEFYNEIDIKWPGFVSSEKARARRLISSQTSKKSISVAPTRKSGVAPVLAPGAPSAISSSKSHTTVNSSVESQLGHTAIESSPATAIDTPTESERRKRPASPIKPDKHESPTVIINSGSSTTSPADDVFVPKRRREAHQATSASTQKLLSHTNGSMSTPVESPTNWEKVLDVVHDADQAIRYHDMFEREYPIYRKCYEKLAKVSAEFNELKHNFDQAPLGSTMQNEIMRKIYDRYDIYQSDSDFFASRAQHANLHAKLAVLKRRINDWDRQLLMGDHHDLSDFDTSKRNDTRHRRSLSSGNSASSTTSMDSSGSGPHGYDEFALV